MKAQHSGGFDQSLAAATHSIIERRRTAGGRSARYRHQLHRRGAPCSHACSQSPGHTSTCPVSPLSRICLMSCRGQQQLVSACLVVGGVAGVPGGVPVGHNPGCNAAVNPAMTSSVRPSTAAHAYSTKGTGTLGRRQGCAEPFTECAELTRPGPSGASQTGGC